MNSTTGKFVLLRSVYLFSHHLRNCRDWAFKCCLLCTSEMSDFVFRKLCFSEDDLKFAFFFWTPAFILRCLLRYLYLAISGRQGNFFCIIVSLNSVARILLTYWWLTLTVHLRLSSVNLYLSPYYHLYQRNVFTFLLISPKVCEILEGRCSDLFSCK